MKGARSQTVPARLAGTWYPAAAADWNPLWNGLTAAGNPNVRALICPHAGVQFSGRTAAKAWTAVEPARVRRVVVVAPAHFFDFEGYSALSADFYETPFGVLKAAWGLASSLRNRGTLKEVAAAHRNEHSLELQLPFIKRHCPDATVLPILIGRLDDAIRTRFVASLVAEHQEGDLLIASSDFTHYGRRFGYLPGPVTAAKEVVGRIDQTTFEQIHDRSIDGLNRHRAASGTNICGADAIVTLLDVAQQIDWQPELVANTTSGALTGDWESSVSYASFVFRSPATLSEEAAALLRERAGDCLSAVIHHQPIPCRRPEQFRTIEENLSLRARLGVFVTLRVAGELRGCLGRVSPRTELVRTVEELATEVPHADSRFDAIRPQEWKQLTFELTVLGPSQRIESPEEIEVSRHGIRVRHGTHEAVLLPQVARDHELDCEQFWRALLKKANLDPRRWADPEVERWRFTVVTLGPVAGAANAECGKS